MTAFADLAAVEESVRSLLEHDEPLVACLPRQAGRKEHRFAHLLSGQPDAQDNPSAAVQVSIPAGGGRQGELEEEVTQLRADLDALRREFEQFRTQFD